MGFVRTIVAAVLGMALAFLLDALIGIPEEVFVLVAVSFFFGFQNVLASERLNRWLESRL